MKCSTFNLPISDKQLYFKVSEEESHPLVTQATKRLYLPIFRNIMA